MDLDIIASVQENIIGHCLCVLGDSMAMPVGEHGAEVPRASSRQRSTPGRERRRRAARRVGRSDSRTGTSSASASDVRAPTASRSPSSSTASRSRRRRGRCWSTPPSTATSRSRCSATSRSSASRSAPAGCAWSRSRGSRSSRPPAPPRSATGWSSTRRPTASRRPRSAVVEFLLVNHPLDCPVCDKGGECPLQDIAMGWGPGQEPVDRPQAPLPEADPALAADQDRPRALHPLLPLRALQPGGGRGRAAPAPGARRLDVRRHVRRPPLHRPLPRQHHRALPGGRADLGGVPVPGPPLGHRGRRHGLHAVPEPVQHQADRPRRAHPARAGPRQPRGRRRLAVRQGPVRLPDGRVRASGSPSRWSAAAASFARRAGSEALEAAAAGPARGRASGRRRSSAAPPRTRRATWRSGSSAGPSARRTWSRARRRLGRRVAPTGGRGPGG